MRVVFFGTSEFAVPILTAIADAGYELCCVVTQPDKPAGRGKKIMLSPVKEKALALGIPVFQPVKVKSIEAISQLAKYQAELFVVVAYGQILNLQLLNIAKYGAINVHGSLLPAYRGAAPIHWAIINGEKSTGVTTMLMNEGLDTGDILIKKSLSIGENDNTGLVHYRLSLLGAEAMLETLELVMAGKLTETRRKQQEEFSSYAKMLTRDLEKIDWFWEAERLHNFIRGMNPTPSVYAMLHDIPLKIVETKLATSSLCGDPGEILAITANKSLLVQTGKGVLEITKVKPAGKKTMDVRDYLHGNKLQVGEKFA
ncbi:MAG: methionyl-tRNA formyltransferase [Clostridia bacterium]